MMRIVVSKKKRKDRKGKQKGDMKESRKEQETADELD